MFGFSQNRQSIKEGQWLDCDGERIWLAWKPHPKARRLKLLMAADGPRLTLPPRVRERDAELFVDQHRQWLEQQWRKRRTLIRPPLQIGQATELPWLGQRLPVKWIEDRALRIVRQPDQWCIHTSARSTDRQLQAALLKDYRHFGHVWLQGVMQNYLAGLPKAPTSLRLRPLRSLWGSLNVADTVTLDIALLLAPSPVAEYVLVHELCHLLQRNHSSRFWHEVESRCPQWREQRDFLKIEGAQIKAEAKRQFG